MYTKILVAIDGSQGSQSALAHATEIASHFHSDLIIAHAIKEERTVYSSPVYDQPFRKGVARKQIGTATVEKSNYDTCADKEKGIALLKEAKSSISLPASQIKTKLLYGDPAKSICEYSKMKEVDLIVMGRRGFHDLRKMVLGSVSEKVAKSAPCPVTIIK